MTLMPCSMTLALMAFQAAVPKPTTFAISAIRASIYLHEKGTVEKEDITNGEVALWNTVLESTTTVVFVDLSGPAFLSGTPGRLELVVRADGKILLRESVRVDAYFSEGTKITVPFLVRGTGCERLQMSAKLSGIPRARLGHAALTNSAPFRCGE